MLLEEEIIVYLFKHTQIQKKVIKEIKNYCKNPKIKKIINILLLERELPITYIDFQHKIRKDKDFLSYFNDIYSNNMLTISNDLYLEELTTQLKKYKYSKLKEKIEKGDISIIENIEKLSKEIKIFNLLVDSEFVSMKDKKSIEKLNKEEINEGFFTGFPQLDHYVKDCGGFLKGTLNIIVAPPHTGKCVIGNTNIIISDDNEENIEKIKIKDLFEKSKFIKTLKDIKFTKSGQINNLKVWTNTGFKNIDYILETKEYEVYKITLDQINNNVLYCADEHIIATLDGLKKTNELIPYQSSIITKNGFSLVLSVEKLNKKEKMYDLQLKEELFTFKNEKIVDYKVGDYLQHNNLTYELYKVVKIENDNITVDLNNHLFYTNDILSHNTLFMTTLASKAILKKKKVLYFSFEMPEIQILKRVYVNICEKEMRNINREMDEVFMIIDTMDDELGELFVKEYPSSFCTPSMIEEILLKMKEEYELDNSKFFPDIIFIDQLTTMGSELKASVGMYERGKAGIEQIKAIIQKFNLIGFAGAQANRKTLKSDKGVQMDNVSESWGIPQIADMGLGAVKDPTSITVAQPFCYDLKITCFKNRLGGVLDDSVWSVNTQKMNFFKRKY